MSPRAIKLVGLALGLALVAGLTPASAQTVGQFCVTPRTCVQLGETLFLSNSADPTDGYSYLFRVHIDPVTDRANLEPLPNFRLPYNQVDAIAGTPDGSTIFFVDKYSPNIPAGGDYHGTGTFAAFDVASGSVNVIGLLHLTNGDTVPGIVLAGFSPSGTLYVASESTDFIYTVNTSNGLATPLGQAFSGSTLIHERGADLAFTVDGTPYLWTNTANGAEAPSGLYRLTLPRSPGSITATHIGSMPGDYFTGIAIRANGMGCMAGSSLDDHIHSQSLSTAQDNPGSPYLMYLGGVRYDYNYGDMSNGPIILCTRTIGWYKNHDWNYGSPDYPATLTLCGVGITQDGSTSPFSEAGQAFLNGDGYDKRPNATDFSMLIAQLIAAKLNTGGSACITWMDGIELWLCQQGIVVDGRIDFHKSFTDFGQMFRAHVYACQLARFNEKYEENCCEDNRDCTKWKKRW